MNLLFVYYFSSLMRTPQIQMISLTTQRNHPSVIIYWDMRVLPAQLHWVAPKWHSQSWTGLSECVCFYVLACHHFFLFVYGYFSSSIILHDIALHFCCSGQVQESEGTVCTGSPKLDSWGFEKMLPGLSPILSFSEPVPTVATVPFL